MKNKKIFFSLLFIVLVIIAAKIFINIKNTPQSPSKLNNLSSPNNNIQQSQSNSNEMTYQDNPSPDLLIEIKKCLKDKAPVSWVTPNALYQHLLSSYTVVDKREDWKNIHIEGRSDGIRRIRLEYDIDEKNKPITLLKAYTLDTENLPIPVKLSQKESINPSKDTLNKYIHNEGNITLEESYLTISFKEESYLNLKIKNTEISSLELHFKDRILQCEETECNCID